MVAGAAAPPWASLGPDRYILSCQHSESSLHCYFPLQIRGLYKGASSSFIGIAVESSLFFGTYSQAKQLLQVLK
jgi:hypothetical protein